MGIRCTLEGLAGLHILLYGLAIEHTAFLSAAIDLIDLSAFGKVNLCVFSPRVNAVAGAIDGGCGKTVVVVLLTNGNVDIHFSIDGAALVVVASVDGALHQGRVALRNDCVFSVAVGFLFHSYRIPDQAGIFTMVFDMRLNNITYGQYVCAVGSAEDTAGLHSRTRWNIHHRTADHTL